MARPGIQPLLFDQSRSFPNGLVYRPDFLTPVEEAELMRELAALPLVQARTGEYTAKRRVLSFGWGYDFEKEQLVPGPPLPPFLARYQRKIAKWLDIPAGRVVEALINEYTAGTALGWHRDNERFETIVGLSLGSWCRMRFRPLAKEHDKKQVLALELEPRSAYIMQGDIRWKYQHSVAATKGLRYSITFRTLPSGIRLPRSS